MTMFWYRLPTGWRWRLRGAAVLPLQGNGYSITFISRKNRYAQRTARQSRRARLHGGELGIGPYTRAVFYAHAVVSRSGWADTPARLAGCTGSSWNLFWRCFGKWTGCMSRAAGPSARWDALKIHYQSNVVYG